MHEAPPNLPLDAIYREMASEPSGLIRRLFELARDEDLGTPPRDLTTESAGLGGQMVAHVRSREEAVLSGLAAIPDLASVFEFDGRFEQHANDGDRTSPGHSVATLSGPTAQVLMLERPLLNILGRLSGVATMTGRFVDAVAGTRAQIVDTRKTTPGLRLLEKYAVRCGGGGGHRMGLHDAVLIKDNHIASATDLADLVTQASAAARSAQPPASFVQVEVDTIDQLQVILSLPDGVVDMVLLDNMGPKQLEESVAMRDRMRPNVLLEASGGVNLETVRAIARAGVDRISVGSLTHASVWIDFGLDAHDNAEG